MLADAIAAETTLPVVRVPPSYAHRGCTVVAHPKHCRQRWRARDKLDIDGAGPLEIRTESI